MENVVHLFEIFKTIFYLKFLELWKVKFGAVKIWKSLNVFEPFEFWKRFKLFDLVPPGTVAGAHRSALASPWFGATRTCAAHEHHGRVVADRPSPAGRVGTHLHLLAMWRHPRPPPATIRKGIGRRWAKFSPCHHFSSQGARLSTHLHSPCLFSAPADRSTTRAIGAAAVATPPRWVMPSSLLLSIGPAPHLPRGSPALQVPLATVDRDAAPVQLTHHLTPPRHSGESRSTSSCPACSPCSMDAYAVGAAISSPSARPRRPCHRAAPERPAGTMTTLGVRALCRASRAGRGHGPQCVPALRAYFILFRIKFNF
jgi:hypothetical protein